MLVKCQYCNVKDTDRDDMEKEVVGKKNKTNKYYHKDCYEKFLVDKKFKEEERLEKDELVNTIMKIYNVKALPPQFYPLLESLRNGQNVFGAKQNTGKRYKQGYSYKLIEKTYIYCEDTIEYWNNRKSFESLIGALKYGLAIIINKIYKVEQIEKDEESKRIMMENQLNSIDNGEYLDFDSNYKRKNDDSDITDFLED